MENARESFTKGNIQCVRIQYFCEPVKLHTQWLYIARTQDTESVANIYFYLLLILIMRLQIKQYDMICTCKLFREPFIDKLEEINGL